MGHEEMDAYERQRIIDSAQALEAWENGSAAFADPYSDMDSIEKSKLIIELTRLRAEDQRRFDMLIERLDAMTQAQVESSAEALKLRTQLAEMVALMREKDVRIAKMEKENLALKERLKLSDKKTYGSNSQKSKKKDDGNSHDDSAPDRQQQKDAFDGTEESLGVGKAEDQGTAQSERSKAKELRPYRMGMEYRTMKADKCVEHASDPKRLPEGATIIETRVRYCYEQKCSIIEHRYQVIRYKMPDGSIREGYFPAEGEPETIDVIPGTHATSSLLAHLAYNKFVLDTPYYREVQRILDERMRLSRMTLCNWLAKGCGFLCEIVKKLKDKCLEKDSIVNCDETWCRVQVEDKYRKRYVWCLVNRQAKVVIYCYEDGSRGRDALKFIIGETPQISALQSDGYNVYMYLDDEMVDVEHLCCMAHARAKFKYALDVAGDEDARYFVDKIGELYKLEDEYNRGRLDAEQIGLCRQSLRTKEIVGEIRSKLDAMLADGHPPRGDLMEKAVNYLRTYWTQLFAYLNDGRYTIDNNIAERNIRPLAGERKNSLFFGSDRMARVSAAYHTVVSTCRAQGISALEYLKRFFGEIAQGRRDYDNLMPMTIGIGVNNH